MVVPCTVRVLATAGTKLVGVPQSKPMDRFLPNSRICLHQEDLELVKIWQYLAVTFAMATLNIFRFSSL